MGLLHVGCRLPSGEFDIKSPVVLHSIPAIIFLPVMYYFLLQLMIISFISFSVNSSWVNENVTDSRLYEGDIEDLPYYFQLGNQTRNQHELHASLRWNVGVWPNGVVPYVLDDTRFDSVDIKFIEAIMREFSYTTCVKFAPRELEKNYIAIKFNSVLCKSKVGFANEGMQTVSLTTHCMNRNDILHELMHVLGFFHEQNRPDRDDYVDVLWDNIDEKRRINFVKRFANVTDYHTPYDFASVMHYPSHGSSKNGKPTIVPHKKEIQIRADGLSEMDILQINRRYNCTNVTKIQASGNCYYATEADTIKRGFRLHNDYGKFRVNSAQECKQVCQEDVRCQAMSFFLDETYVYENCFVFGSSYWSTSHEQWAMWKKPRN